MHVRLVTCKFHASTVIVTFFFHRLVGHVVESKWSKLMAYFMAVVISMCGVTRIRSSFYLYDAEDASGEMTVWSAEVSFSLHFFLLLKIQG